MRWWKVRLNGWHTLGKVSNGNMIDQWATHKRLKAAGKINWIIKNDQNRGWEVNSSFNIQNTPQSLLVQPCLFGEILEKDGLESMGQQVELIAVSNREQPFPLVCLEVGRLLRDSFFVYGHQNYASVQPVLWFGWFGI